ncbi:WSCD family member CG9164-like isoform X2 [Dysidea avara]|uniref:WSCD family member CG9164-like isoform X2 n=1 Tax=Dysidea avara TaxID=196820 RepID=UPI00331F5B0C
MNVFRSVKCASVIVMANRWHSSLVELPPGPRLQRDRAQDSTETPSQPVTGLPNVQLNKGINIPIPEVRKQFLNNARLVKPNEKIIPNVTLVPLQLVKGSQYLDERIKQLYLSCRPKKLRKDAVDARVGQCKNFTDMRFIDGSRVVALPSYPGSGNTWTRMLLEQTTGIYTGSIYCDTELKARGFLGEKLSSSNVLAVKTHYPSKDLFVPYREYHDPGKFKNVSAAIVIIRNPLDSLVSHWNWKHGGHVSVMRPALFVHNTKWKRFIKTSVEQFVSLVRYWLEEAQISVLVIKYEDMVTDLSTQLTKMLDFLQVNYSQSDIDCVMDDTLEMFRRKKTVPSEFNPYVPSYKQFVLDKFTSIKPILEKYNIYYEPSSKP